ncbi:tripartite tricarboxylate transporter substrate binding protein [Bradyrhizobium diazoefficiens]|uniref:Bug family tripartite tricarboxylate transporter substrate binding protein n=1 Tax=Bradyrhizobium diazoefficiens TaxID=1355477 RepID=UPI00190A4267|nr:tripartite tricarboxylate transporter substrate-binding protein [Bradyrhizobium diazoefficiens]QQO12502.1 tripartite tricarboxylate transporter substrate binding protein [Bradyrhizobium diazoefficiens]
MTIRILTMACLAVAVTFATVSAREASAQPFPSRRVTLTVPFPAGSATDGVTRRLAESIQNQAGVTVLVENKPGADGNLAALSVLRADADGYNVFVTTNSTHAANVNLFNEMPFDPKADFAPVAGIMSIPLLLTVKNDFPARTVAEFVALAKTRAQPLSFGSGNTSSRGAAELFRYDAGIKMQHVPYRGMPQALTDLLSGQIDCVFADPASAQGLIQDHQLRVLAVTSGERIASLPDAPTMTEIGLQRSELTAWVGVFVRSGTPAEVIDRLNRFVRAFLETADTRVYLESVGAKPFLTTPAELGLFADADTRRWAQIVEIAKIEKK